MNTENKKDSSADEEIAELRNVTMRFRVSSEEKEFIEKKAKLSGSKNVSSYLRKIAITGRIINYSADDFKSLRRDIIGIKNNINQIALRVNSTHQVYSDDIQEIQGKVEQIWQQLQSIQSMLHCTKP